MSDFKAKFKQAAAQRGAAVPTKEQLKALKSQKHSAPAPQKVTSISAASSTLKPTSAVLPAGFFDSAQHKTHDTPSSMPGPPHHATPPAAAASAKTTTSAMPPPQTLPHRPAPARAGAAAGVAKGPLPEGFFEDRTADAAARGVKLPDAKSKEAEFQAFTRALEEDLNTQAAEAAEVAEEEAEDKEERDEFEQQLRLQRVEQLRQRKARLAQEAARQAVKAEGSSVPSDPGGQGHRADAGARTSDTRAPDAADSSEAQLPLLLPLKRRRVVDVLQKALQGDKSESDDSDGDGEDSVTDFASVVNWRAKAL